MLGSAWVASSDCAEKIRHTTRNRIENNIVGTMDDGLKCIYCVVFCQSSCLYKQEFLQDLILVEVYNITGLVKL